MAAQRVLVIDDSPTIHKVVAHALKRLGLEVISVCDGELGVSKAKALRPDLILLDLMMPGMNGYQVCKALGDVDELEQTPIVLMSAKGEMMGEKLVKTMGIVDFITKPFSPDAVAAVVQRAMEKTASGSHRNVGGESHLLEGDRRKPETRQADGGLANPPGRVALRGNLGMVPVPEIFQLLKGQAHTGVLHLAHGKRRLEVFLREGMVLLARAIPVDEGFLLGRFLIEVGAIAERDLERFLQDRPGTDRLFGQQLVELGHINQKQLTAALSRQTQELLYEAIRWAQGQFAFYVVEDLPVLAQEANLQLSIDPILIEGFRRADEWDRIEKEINDFAMVLAPRQDWTGANEQIELPPDEEKILALVDGRRTIADVVHVSRRSAFDVCRILHRLLARRIVHKRPASDPSGR